MRYTAELLQRLESQFHLDHKRGLLNDEQHRHLIWRLDRISGVIG